ncbi:hypothetical protein GQR36_20385 [Enterococcus termitis]
MLKRITTYLMQQQPESMEKVNEVLVIWRARSQADGPCQEYNRRIMTVEEFKARYPVHYNCMCTAELIPPTMSDKRIKNFYLKNNGRLQHD